LNTEKFTDPIIPGSPEAKALGCICESPKGNQYFINEYCPLHWHILLASQTKRIYDHTIRADSQNLILIVGLIIAVSVTFAYFLSL